MSIAREAAYAALYTRIKTVTGVLRFSRRLVAWDKLSKAEMPAVMVVPESCARSESSGLDALWTLHASVYVVTPPDQSGDGAETTLLTIVDRIDAALDKNTESARHYQGQSETTLGGAVYKAWISGEIELDAGLNGEVGVARIPVSMLLPG